MELQGRTYMTNGQSILMKEYEDVNKAQNNLDLDFQKSLGSVGYQTSSKFPPNQENSTLNNNNFYSASNLNYPTQNFGNTFNQMSNSNGFAISNQKQFAKTDINGNPIMEMNQTQNMDNKGMNDNNELVYVLTENSRKQLEIEVEKLYDYYYMTKGYFQSVPEELFKFYLDYKRRYNKGQRVPKKFENLMKFREEDVDECIRYFLENVRNRFKSSNSNANASTYQNSKFFRSMSAKKGFDNTIKNTYTVKLTKETEERLYPRLKEIEKREKEKQNCDDFNSYFKKLLKHYYKQKGKYTNNPDVLIDYYKSIPNKDKKRMEWENGENDFVENMELFFDDEEIINRLSDIFYKHTKFRTYDPITLHNHWEHFMTKEDRYLNGLNKYSKDDFFSLLESYNNQKKAEKKKNQDELDEAEKAQKEQEYLDYKARIRETKEEREELINKLAQPKDKYKTGRVMMELKNKFQYDNIIKKMIKNEFRDNKLFKFPEEYAVRDEEEQKDIFFKHDLDGSLQQKIPNEKIEKQIEDAYEQYNYQRDKNRPRIEKRMKQKKDLFDFIKKKVIENYKNMESRLTQDKKGVESINLFLNNLYKEMSRKHREATKLYFKRPRI